MDVTVAEVLAFSRLFGRLVSEGTALAGSLERCAGQTASADLARCINGVKDSVLCGNSLPGALARYPDVFDRNYVAMVRRGELAGNVDDVLLRYAAP